MVCTLMPVISGGVSAKYQQYSVNDCMTNLIEEIADVEICIEYLKLINEQTSPDFREKN